MSGSLRREPTFPPGLEATGADLRATESALPQSAGSDLSLTKAWARARRHEARQRLHEDLIFVDNSPEMPSCAGPAGDGSEVRPASLPDDFWDESSFILETSPAQQNRIAGDCWEPSVPGLSASPNGALSPGLPASIPAVRATEPQGFTCGFGRVPQRSVSFETARSSFSPGPVAKRTLQTPPPGPAKKKVAFRNGRRRNR